MAFSMTPFDTNTNTNTNPNENFYLKPYEEDDGGTPIVAIKNHLQTIGYVNKESKQEPLFNKHPIMDVPTGNMNTNSNIMNLASDINRSLNNYPAGRANLYNNNSAHKIGLIKKEAREKFKSKGKGKDEDEDEYEDEDEDTNTDDDNETIGKKIKKKSNKSSSIIPNIPNSLKEVILLVSIYYILSQSFMQVILAKYIKYTVPKDGIYSSINIIIYGIILSVIFILLRDKLIYES
jgi:hypothetical protein